MSIRRILLAEDHVETRKIIGLVVAEDGFELLEASDGEEALDLALLHRPDLVLLDLMLPNLGGIEICRRLRADPEMYGTKIVVLTGRKTRIDKDLALESGVDAFITKPFGPAKLLDTIREMLSRPALGEPAATTPNSQSLTPWR